MAEQPYSVTKKTLGLILLVTFYTVGYIGINRLNDYRNHYYDVSLWFEKDIPFVPCTIIGYSFVFLLVAILFLVIDNMPDFWDMCIRFINMSLLCFIIFLIFPVRMDLRPEVGIANDWITELVRFYFWVDHPYNLFPSMHLSASFFSAFYCMRKGRIIGWITMIMAITVGVSVVLLKQHYIMDVVAGLFVGWFCSFFSMRKIKARLLMRPDKNESRQVGMKFESLIELSPKRSGAGLVPQKIILGVKRRRETSVTKIEALVELSPERSEWG